MKAYLLWLGATVITLSVVGGALSLSASYAEYVGRLRVLDVPAGHPTTLFDTAKWQFARLVGMGMLFGGVILGSLLMGMGWIGKTLEEVRDALAGDLPELPAGDLAKPPPRTDQRPGA